MTFLGTADAFNGAGRGNSCYLIEDTLGMYTVDFGPTALLKCEEYGADLDRLDAVYITHLHGDHIGGIAMLLVYLQFRMERTRPLVIAGPEGVEERLALLRESAYPSVVQSGLDFPIEFVHWKIPGTTEVLGRQVTAIRAVHDKLAVASSLRVDTPEASICFSGDTGWQDDLGTLVDGSNLFICECSMVEADYWGHLSLEELQAHRDKLNVGQLFLSHMSEAARRQATAQAEQLRAQVADDGLIINL